MDNFIFLYPIIVLVILMVFEHKNRMQRQNSRSESLPRTETKQETMKNPEWWENDCDDTKEKEIPWYVEFPEDREPKEWLEKEQSIYQELPIEELTDTIIAPEALYKKFEKPKQDTTFKGFRKHRTIANDVRFGFVLAQILDKPRSLKPYDGEI